MSGRVDVTDQVTIGSIEDECVPLRRCVCGESYEDWNRIIGIYEDLARPCRRCGVRLVFEMSVRVYRIEVA